jgi:putative membrane protein
MLRGDTRSMLPSMSRVRSAWWLRRVLFTAVLWTVEAGVLVGLTAVLDGFSIADFRSGLALVVVMAILNAALWPLALRLTFPLAFFTLGLMTLLLNGAVAWLAGAILPGVEVDFWGGVVIALVLAFVQLTLAALFNQADDSYDRRIVRRSARREHEPLETDVPGLLFLEIDGLA